MSDLTNPADQSAETDTTPTAAKAVRAPRKRAAKKTAAVKSDAPVISESTTDADPAVLDTPDAPSAPTKAAKKSTKKAVKKSVAPAASSASQENASQDDAASDRADTADGADSTAKAPARRTRAKKATAEPESATLAPSVESSESSHDSDSPESAPSKSSRRRRAASSSGMFSAAISIEPAVATPVSPAAFVAPLFVAPDTDVVAVVDDETDEPQAAPATRPSRRRRGSAASAVETVDAEPDNADEIDAEQDDADADGEEGSDDAAPGEGTGRRRRRRGGRNRRRRGGADRELGDDLDVESLDLGATDASGAEQPESADGDAADEEGGEGTGRRRRRRRRRGSEDAAAPESDDPPNTVVRVREGRQRGQADDGVTSVRGSTRLEAKKQRRRDGRDAGRRRPSLLTEAEFLARRESVERVMAVRQIGDRTQIAVLEDGVLVEHYVNRSGSGSLIGNVYLGRVQNVLPSMEAAFIDIGRGRNAVLYAGEVNWDAAGLEGQPKRIELAMKPGDSVLVQVTKDSVGHKGARLTSQISLPGRFLVYVPNSSMTGISRKLPDTERSRLKSLLRKVLPEDAGVIVRTAAEGASSEELTLDVENLAAQWTDITATMATASAPTLLYGEPDLAIKVVRDIFNEDVKRLLVAGDTAWKELEPYITRVAPDLAGRLEKYVGAQDLFAHLRVDEQLAKALDRKVYLPSGGSLVIDRTEAMTVIDVNTGKFVGQGGNLEETVTRNNIEAAEEIVRQLRLRDVGGIIVIDFIDMVLEDNRDLVLRRLLECLGRDRTKHQVAEVTSLGLVQMTRKRLGEGLIEAFSETCEHCHGRGLLIRTDPVARRREEPRENQRESRRNDHEHVEPAVVVPSKAAAAAAAKVAAAARAAHEEHHDTAVVDAEVATLAATEPGTASTPAAREAASEVASEVASGATPGTLSELQPAVEAPARASSATNGGPAGTTTAPPRRGRVRRGATRSAGPAAVPTTDS